MSAPLLTLLVCALWSVTLLAFAAAPLLRSARDAAKRLSRLPRAEAAFVVVLLAIAVAYGGTKPANPPPPAPAKTGRINLYVDDGHGRLIPLDAKITEAP